MLKQIRTNSAWEVPATGPAVQRVISRGLTTPVSSKSLAWSMAVRTCRIRQVGIPFCEVELCLERHHPDCAFSAALLCVRECNLLAGSEVSLVSLRGRLVFG